jgi:hypothetical protein
MTGKPAKPTSQARQWQAEQNEPARNDDSNRQPATKPTTDNNQRQNQTTTNNNKPTTSEQINNETNRPAMKPDKPSNQA